MTIWNPACDENKPLAERLSIWENKGLTKGMISPSLCFPQWASRYAHCLRLCSIPIREVLEISFCLTDGVAEYASHWKRIGLTFNELIKKSPPEQKLP